MSPDFPTRPYVSAKRDAAAAAKRQHVLDVATRLLSEGEQMISMESVAKAAGVTRLTVYKQFGSRRGLLEAIFDANAAQYFHRIGHHLNAGADAGKAVRLFINLRVKASLTQRCGHGQPTHTRTDNSD